jgi:DNA-binding IclR family transcriptional regulator
VTTSATVAGVTLADLASRLGLTRAEARRLVTPFVRAGLVVEHDDGRLELVDRDVAYAIVSEAPPP